MFLKGDPLANIDAWDHLKVRNQGYRDPGGENLLFLFENIQELKPNEFEPMSMLFKDDRWKCSARIIRDAYWPQFELMQKVNKRKTGRKEKI